MLGDISWGAYAATLTVLLGLWYGYVIIRFYRGEAKDIFNGKSKINLLKNKKETAAGPFAEYNEPFDTLEDAEALHEKLLNVFAESAERGISRVEYLNYIRFVLEEYPFVKQSALREKITSLMVLESQKYPALLLTSQEADRLWEFEK